MRAIIDRFETTFAVLRMESGQELTVPKAELPKDVHEGTALFLLFSENATEEEHREKLAKSILNEILNTET